jgi:YVTN family beta-propeller protein
MAAKPKHYRIVRRHNEFEMRLMSVAILLAVSASLIAAADYRTPAGTLPARRTENGHETVLPGGRLLAPHGAQYTTGPGPFGLAISPNGDRIVSANGGPDRFTLTFLERTDGDWRTRNLQAVGRRDAAESDEDDWKSTFMGLAFDGDNLLYASEGESGRVRALHPATGRRIRSFNLNTGGYGHSYSGDVAFDRDRGLLYVVDQANFRVAIFDTRKAAYLASVAVGRLPFALALSPDAQRLYVTNVGMFSYKPIPRADPKHPRETGLDFPPFGFPSKDAERGANRKAMNGTVRVPGLGSPNTPASNSLCVVDVSNPGSPKIVKFIRTGLPLGRASYGGSSPAGVLAAGNRVYVSNSSNDSISVIDAATLETIRDIPIRIPGLESYRGVLPIGLAFDPASSHLLVAEAGINSVGVLDPASGEILGHIPCGWFPTRVAIRGSEVYVTNAKGHGIGPNATLEAPLPKSFQGERRKGSLSLFPTPAAGQLAALSETVLRNNGFQPAGDASPLPAAIRHVVLIVKENRTFDEVFGDIAGAPGLARWGRRITPNHHAIAERWSMSDNFYADSEVSVDGHHWLVGSYPNVWTESTLMAAYGGEKKWAFTPDAPGRLLFAGSSSSVHPEEQLEAGTLWHLLERHGISFRNFGEGFELAGVDEGEGLKPTGARYFTNIPMPDPLYRNTSRTYPNYNTNIPDQFRAGQFIGEIESLYLRPGKPLPRFIFIHLPNDHTAKPRPKDGYPESASYVADNDYALGRILQFLSHTPWWRDMAVFITEDDAQGGVDHVDAHRTVMLLASPYAQPGCVDHANSSFPGLLKTVFRLLALPGLNLYDVAARDLGHCFTAKPNFEPFTAIRPPREVFVPENAREPLDRNPGPAMDDPKELRRQHDENRP